MRAGQASSFTLELNEQERNELLVVLEQALEEGRVERRRTEAFEAKEIVRAQVDTLEELVKKVRQLYVSFPAKTAPGSSP